MNSQITENTGIVPPPMYGENQFNNVNIENANVSPSPPSANANAPDIGTGESLATAESDNIATAEPAISIPKTAKSLSSKQTELMRLRATTLEDMREKYSERFGDTSVYPKPPKAKVYHASGLTTIRQRDGETAYTAALKDIMDKNDPILGPAKISTTRKAKKNSVNSTRNNSAATTRVASDSIEEMGRSAKSLIDSMIQVNKELSRAMNRQKNMPLIPLANVSMKVKKPRTRATRKATATATTAKPLFTVPEETSANIMNSTSETNRGM